MKTINKNYVNHISFCVDASGSMGGRESDVIKLFDNYVKYLAKRSKELDQETRISVYLFHDTTIDCIVYDMDAMRLPSLSGFYRIGGGTPLIDATIKSITDLKLLPEIYGDHAFLAYICSDGLENTSVNSSVTLSKLIRSLPDNWTVATLVPDQDAVFEAKKSGFPADNIQVWNTNIKGVDEIEKIVASSTESFFRGRAAGIRGTKTLFKIDVSGVSSSKVRDNLEELHPREFNLLTVDKDGPAIRDFVESKAGSYRPGCAFYELTKAETIQVSKEILIQNRISSKVYAGSNARKLLGLPNNELRVKPENFGNYKIFIQSTSVNRKLVRGTTLIALKK